MAGVVGWLGGAGAGLGGAALAAMGGGGAGDAGLGGGGVGAGIVGTLGTAGATGGVGAAAGGGLATGAGGRVGVAGALGTVGVAVAVVRGAGEPDGVPTVEGAVEAPACGGRTAGAPCFCAPRRWKNWYDWMKRAFIAGSASKRRFRSSGDSAIMSLTSCRLIDGCWGWGEARALAAGDAVAGGRACRCRAATLAISAWSGRMDLAAWMPCWMEPRKAFSVVRGS